MIAKVKQFYTGFGLMIGFMIVLVFFFLPFYEGKNALDYLDNLYNSISKGSAYYIPKVKEETARFNGNVVNMTLATSSPKQAEQTALLFKAGGADAMVKEAQLQVAGDLGKILENALADADIMYRNEGKKVVEKYGYDERQVLFNWWKAMQEMDKDLGKQKKFKEGKAASLVQKKAIEASYNYYKIEAQQIGERLGTVLFSLVFYVIYTLWYGFSILFMFEGWGLKLGH
jgi:hypothetical protein